MPRDPRNGVAGDVTQPVVQEGPSGLAPEEVAEPGRVQNAADADWLSMATADPVLFLKDSEAE